MAQSHNTYDAIIIGAGISGLICGCYLAKSGMKVLVVEQHHKPGGYCTSFRRQGFTFDAAAHSFGGLRRGNLQRIFNDLELSKRIKIKQSDPSDIIISPDYKVAFYADIRKTIREFQTAFPSEKKQIENFFYFLANPELKYLTSMRSMTFQYLLDDYFSNQKLKSILSLPLLGNGGLPPSLMSAFIGIKIYTEFLLDGGYYPEGGMQQLPFVLSEKFKEYGGELLLSSPVKKIKLKNKAVEGVFFDKKFFVGAKCVISSCDARQTFLRLLGKSAVDKEFLGKLTIMTPSLSAFILYLGLSKHFNNDIKRTNIWFLTSYDLEKMYLSSAEGNLNRMNYYLIHVIPRDKVVLAYINTAFKNKTFWLQNKKSYMEYFIKNIENDLFPGFSEYIVYKEAATPHTLFRYTSNYKGAAYGWAPTPSQFALPNFRQPSFVRGLYLTGHWTTFGLGIPGVAYTGYDTAKLVLRKSHKRFFIVN